MFFTFYFSLRTFAKDKVEKAYFIMEETKYSIPSEWKSAIQGKCPRCRTSNMFEKSLFSIGSRKMRTQCLHCGLKFEKEPGYFYVAMYISYVFVVAELVTACVGAYIITGNLDSPWLYLSVALVTAIVLAPFNYRYSRIVLLYWLTPAFKFRPDLYASGRED